MLMLFAILLAGAGLPAPAHCQSSVDDWKAVNDWRHAASEAERLLDLPQAERDRITTDRWEDLRLDLTVQREQALQLIERGTLRGRIVTAQLAELAEPAASPGKGGIEPAWVRNKRAALNARLEQEEGPAIAARDIHAQALVLTEVIDEILRTKRRKAFFAHDWSIFEPRTWAIAGHELRAGGWRPTPAVGIEALPTYGSLAALSLPTRMAAALLLAAGMLWAAFRSRSALRKRIYVQRDQASPRGQLGLAFVRDLLDVAIPAVAFMLMLALIHLLSAELPILASLSGATVMAGITIIYARWLGQSLFAPAFPPAQLIQLPDGRTYHAIALATALGICLAANGLLDAIEAFPHNPPALTALMGFAIILVTALCLWRMAMIVAPARGARTVAAEEHKVAPAQVTGYLGSISRGMTAIAMVASVLALVGFLPLARHILFATIASMVCVSTALFLFRSLTEAAELLLARRELGQSRYLQLLPLLFGFLLTMISLPVLAIIWGVSAEAIVDGILALKNGVALGDIHLSFGSVMTFGLVFLLGYALTRWLQRLLHYVILDRLRVEQGVQAAVLTGFGYLGLTLSALVAITTAGVDLSNLAYIAGALSVGIGFGLQSVVANFVSGVILLIERPIKKGDWIEVAGVSGHVRKIAFRSTHIETFDKHEVILPNSALTSGNVTNLTYGDSEGRISLPVGVGYGSDLAAAKVAMLGVAQQHPDVLPHPAPTVVMDGLGESSIDLKLLCFVGDVNDRTSVRSDLYFALVEALASARIAIPFPQRDVWLRDARTGDATTAQDMEGKARA